MAFLAPGLRSGSEVDGAGEIVDGAGEIPELSAKFAADAQVLKGSGSLREVTVEGADGVRVATLILVEPRLRAFGRWVTLDNAESRGEGVMSLGAAVQSMKDSAAAGVIVGQDAAVAGPVQFHG